MLQNNTAHIFQLRLHVGTEFLEGEWLVSEPLSNQYRVVEKNHRVESEYWGGYSRHNELYQQKLELDGQFISEHLAVKNSALMMYPPFLSAHGVITEPESNDDGE